MLILTRKMNESIMIGEDIQVTIVDINNRSVKLGIAAPKNIAVHRKEVHDLIIKENLAAGQKSKTEEEKNKIVSLLEFYKTKDRKKDD